MGVWIETEWFVGSEWHYEIVTPYVGVWIETGHDVIAPYIVSHTLRGCVD